MKPQRVVNLAAQDGVRSFITLWPSGQSQPVVSSLNFAGTEPALSNGAIVGLSTNVQDLSAYVGSNSAVHIIIDVTGYFQ